LNIGMVKNVSGSGDVEGEVYVGGLVGEYSYGLMINCSSSADVIGDYYVGGLAGFNDRDGIVSNSQAHGNVRGQCCAGGLVGHSGLGGEITFSHSSGKVEGESRIGGIVGYNDRGTVRDSSTNHAVDGYESVGGIIGYNDQGSLEDSNSSADVSGVRSIGGLMGMDASGSTEGSKSDGQVEGIIYVGGLIGRTDDSSVHGSAFNGTVEGEMDVGGLIGYVAADVNSSYYNVDTVKINGGHHLTVGGLFDEQYRDWAEDGNLDITDYDSTLVPSSDVHLINDAEGMRDLLGFADGEGLSFRISDDIDLSEQQGLFIPYLMADLDGNGHRIEGLRMDNAFVSKAGLFGINHGTVSNLTLKCDQVKGHTSVGALVGENHGKIVDSQSSGLVIGYDKVGGMVGMNHGTVQNCYAEGDMVGYSELGTGGLVGENAGVVESGGHNVSISYRTLIADAEVRDRPHHITEEVMLNGSASEGDITDWIWAFYEEGKVVVSGETATHLFEDKGVYDVELFIKDEFGFIGTDTVQAEVIEYVLISDVEGLQDIKDDLDGYYYLDTDIDGSGTEAWNGGEGFEPIGTEESPFNGYLDGQGHSVEGLFINRSIDDSVGVFGHIGPEGEVSDVDMIDVSVRGNDHTGALAGYNEGSINTCSVDGNVFSENHCGGGLVGVNEGGIAHSSSTASVTVLNYGGGGLVGYNAPGGEIEYSHSQGHVSAKQGIGGLVGYNHQAEVEHSSSSGFVEGDPEDSWSVGGLVGYNDRGTVTQSHSSADVVGYRGVGGLIGDNQDSEISDSYAVGDVEGKEYVGGLVGWSDGTILRSYSSGAVVADDYFGGLVGLNDGAVTDSFWNVDTSGKVTSAGGTGLTHESMLSQDTFTAAGWDFEDVWWMADGVTFPLLEEGDVWAPEIVSKPPDLVQAPLDFNYAAEANETVEWFFSFHPEAGFLSFDVGDALTVTAEPGSEDEGEYWVNIIAVSSEGKGSSSQNFTFSVLPATEIVSEPVTEGRETISYGYQVEANLEIPEGNWSVVSDSPFTLTMGPDGLLSCQPSPGHAGHYHVNITAVSEQGVPAWQNFTLQIIRIPSDIFITEQPKLDYVEGEEQDLSGMEVTLVFSSGDPHTYAWVEGGNLSATPVNGTEMLRADHDGEAISIEHDEGPINATAPLSVERKIIDVSIADQPSLEYEEGEFLDLSGMNVTLHYLNGSDYTYAWAEGGNLSATPVNGTEMLRADHDGSTVTVNHTPSELSNDTALLSVERKNVVNGTVIDADGNPLTNLEIHLDGEKVTSTDENGTFSLLINEGVYELEAHKEGYSTETLQLEVEGDENLKIEMTPIESDEEEETVESPCMAILIPLVLGAVLIPSKLIFRRT